jgi:hypothetical protein
VKRLVALAAGSGIVVGALLVETHVIEFGAKSQSKGALQNASWAATGPMNMSKLPDRVPVSGKRGNVVGFALSEDLFGPGKGDPVVYDTRTGKAIGRLTEHGVKRR